jgi:hypothetical protein
MFGRIKIHRDLSRSLQGSNRNLVIKKFPIRSDGLLMAGRCGRKRMRERQSNRAKRVPATYGTTNTATNAAHRLRKFFYGHNCRGEQRMLKRLELVQKAKPLTQDSASISWTGIRKISVPCL